MLAKVVIIVCVCAASVVAPPPPGLLGMNGAGIRRGPGSAIDEAIDDLHVRLDDLAGEVAAIEELLLENGALDGSNDGAGPPDAGDDGESEDGDLGDLGDDGTAGGGDGGDGGDGTSGDIGAGGGAGDGGTDGGDTGDSGVGDDGGDGDEGRRRSLARIEATLEKLSARKLADYLLNNIDRD